jgi:hypothetical protein
MARPARTARFVRRRDEGSASLRVRRIDDPLVFQAFSRVAAVAHRLLRRCPRDMTPPADPRRFLSAVRAPALIDQILDRARAAHSQLYFCQHDARRLLVDAGALEPLATQRSLTLEIHVPSEEVVVVCDRERLLRALVNLFTNAMRFAPAGSVVSLALERVEGDAAFSISVESDCAVAFELLLFDVRALLAAHAGRAWVSSASFATTLSLFLRATCRASSDRRRASPR